MESVARSRCHTNIPALSFTHHDKLFPETVSQIVP
ncbi:hypothetical protein ABIB73_006930 [Bradyrhizobium sp. F1.4.3]